MKKIGKIVCIVILPLILTFSCKPYHAVQKKIEGANQDSIQVVTLDGKTHRGKALLPQISSKLVVLSTSSDDELEIPSTDVGYILAWHKDQTIDKAHKFIYTNIKEYESLELDNQTLIEKEEPRWLLELCVVDNMTLYVEYQKYDIKKEGDIDGHTKGVVSNPPNTWYYIQKEGEKSPIRVALDASAGAASKKYFKNVGQKYFADCPPVVEKIKEEKLNTETIEEAMKEYSECK